MNNNCLCANCMKEKQMGDVYCPHCGFPEEITPPNLRHLKPFSMLNGKYRVGRVLGQGGFGITYVGFDVNLELKVAIKEYFPDGFAMRDHNVSNEIQINDENGVCAREQERFLEEARILAQCEELTGIVRVRDYFKENNTSYIVMEYVEGETLFHYMKKHGGKLEAEVVFAMMKPAIKSLIQIHKRGVVHKDISPDNIMITGKNSIKLIDFGSANRGSEKGAYNTFKRKYSPLEQRKNHTEVGTYSDIYAFCATMYYAMTGTAPIDAEERMKEDTLLPLSKLGVKISPVQEAALMKGLEIQPEDRLQDAKDLYYFMYQFGQIEEQKDGLSRSIEKEKTDELLKKVKSRSEAKRLKRWQGVLIVLIVASLAVFPLVKELITEQGKKETVKPSKLSKELLEATRKTESAELTDMAELFAETLEEAEKSDVKNGWDAVYQEALQEVIDQYGTFDGSWMVIPMEEVCSAEQVLKKGLSNEANAIAYKNCSKIGIAVVDSELGYIFYVVFME